MGLREALPAGPVAVDTALFIYLIERNPTYLPATRELFSLADRGEVEIVTSALTLLEVLVAPYRAGNTALANRYEALLRRSRGIRLVETDLTQLRTAALIRAAYRVRTPDALQLSAAITERCPVLVTSDRRLPDLPGVRVVQLGELV